MTDSIHNTKYVIYMHTNIITGKSYIGKTINGMERRWQQHKSKSIKNNDNFKFYNSIRKYGADCWEHEILFYCLNDNNFLNEVEIKLIEDWNTHHNGYNSTKGGDGGLGSGIDHPCWGRKHTKESKKIMSKNITGEKHSSFDGFYIYQNIKFTSTRSLGNFIGTSKRSIRKWCIEFDKPISTPSYTHSKFLQSLGTKEEIVGLTYADIGFSFEPI